MPPKKAKATSGGAVQHPIDASGVLQAAKDGDWPLFRKLLASQSQLTFADFNTLPPGRSFGVAHQIAYHGDLPALSALVARHPQVRCRKNRLSGSHGRRARLMASADVCRALRMIA